MSQDKFSHWVRGLGFEHWSTGQHIIDATAFLKMQAQGRAVLLDVRTEEEARAVSFPHALHIPLNELPDRFDEVPRGRLVATFCSGGDRAAIAYAYLRVHGHPQVRILKGGYSTLMPALMPGHLRMLLREASGAA